MGLFAIGALILSIGLGILVVRVVWWFISVSGIGVYALITYLFHAIFVRSSLNKDNFLQKQHEAEDLELKLREAEANRLHAEQVKSAQDKIVYATLRKRRELEANYPLADRELFDKYMNGFNTRPLSYCDKVAELIRTQHAERLEATATGQYTLTEVVAMDKVCESQQDSIRVTTYRKAADLVVLVTNEKTEFNTFFVTKDPVLAKRLAVTIVNSQLVKSVSAELADNTTLTRLDVNDAYAKAVADVNRLRGITRGDA